MAAIMACPKGGRVLIPAGNYRIKSLFLKSNINIELAEGAVLLRDGYSYVFRLGQDNRVTQTKVATGQRVGERVAISGGLEPGTVVVASGVGFLSDGDLVRVVAAPTGK